jgi:hypothetical protein
VAIFVDGCFWHGCPLKDVLGRIILVPDQEEVADAFPNNKYLVELIDGTSRVSLMAE